MIKTKNFSLTKDFTLEVFGDKFIDPCSGIAYFHYIIDWHCSIPRHEVIKYLYACFDNVGYGADHISCSSSLNIKEMEKLIIQFINSTKKKD